MIDILVQFLVFLTFIGVVVYTFPASLFYFFYYKRSKPGRDKIQPKSANKDDITREVKLSIGTILIMSISTTILFQFVSNGHSKMYYEWSKFPTYYHFLSFFLCLVLHDTYFYWTHRFMHWRPVFKYFHKGHHKSLTPSPWASLAFQPLEALVQFGTFALIIFIIPLHPIVLTSYILYDTIVNTAGHNGFKLVPKWVERVPILKLNNNVTHHEIHHKDFKSNYGAFFNLWDRLMGTFRPDL